MCSSNSALDSVLAWSARRHKHAPPTGKEREDTKGERNGENKNEKRRGEKKFLKFDKKRKQTKPKKERCMTRRKREEMKVTHYRC